MANHATSHFDETPFGCSKCNQTYKKKFERNHHERFCSVSHKFSCKFSGCEFTYADPKYYNEHVCTKHSKKGIFKCPLCPATFKYHNGRALHLKKHEHLSYILFFLSVLDFHMYLSMQSSTFNILVCLCQNEVFFVGWKKV